MNYILLNISDLKAENLIAALIVLVMVFLVLVILYCLFKIIPKLMEWNTLRNMKKQGIKVEEKPTQLGISAGVDAAISAALYLYLNDIHDEENTIMTIKRVSRTYSPWSSKLYSMRWPLR